MGKIKLSQQQLGFENKRGAMSELSYRISLADAMTKLVWGTARWQREAVAAVDEITVTAARNEVTGVQVHFSADHDFVLVVDRANWLHPSGFTPRVRLEVRFPSLPAGAVEIFPVGWMEGDDRRWWMETFERSGYAEAQAKRPRAAYLRIRVPEDLQAGQHVGQVRAFAQQGFADEALIWEGTVQLEVASAVLPHVKDYDFHLNLWQHLTALSRFHRVALWSEDHFAIIERYYASLAQLGQKAVSIVVSEFPWSGQRCYRDRAYPSYLFEHAQIGVTRSADGNLHLDFAVLDRVLALASKYHMDREINLIGLLNIWVDEEYGFGKVAQDAPDAVRVRCYDEASGSFTYLRTAAELRLFIRSLHDHLNEIGVMERVRVTADEPGNLEAFNRSLAFIQDAGPDFQYGAAINHFEFLEDAPPNVLDFTPVLPLACKDPALTARLADGLHKRGGRLFWYVCCWPPIPNTFLHSPLVEARLHGWLTHALHLDGFLRWAFCLWPADPWNRASWRAPDWNAGDMFFVMPGLDGAPVETLRYEGLRMAAQDYELLRMVERKLPEDQAQALIEQAFRHIVRVESIGAFANVGTAKAEELYSLDPADYHAARRVLLQGLDGLAE
jgi:hypothetical protein